MGRIGRGVLWAEGGSALRHAICGGNGTRNDWVGSGRLCRQTRSKGNITAMGRAGRAVIGLSNAVGRLHTRQIVTLAGGSGRVGAACASGFRSARQCHGGRIPVSLRLGLLARRASPVCFSRYTPDFAKAERRAQDGCGFAARTEAADEHGWERGITPTFAASSTVRERRRHGSVT